MIISEASGVSPQANGWVEAPALYNDRHVEGWKQVVERAELLPLLTLNS